MSLLNEAKPLQEPKKKNPQKKHWFLFKRATTNV